MANHHHFYGRLLLLTAMILGGTLRGADTVNDPDLDFIQLPDAVLVEVGLLRNDTIKRLELNVSGTGKPYVFLTFEGNGSKGGEVWVCYEPIESGNYRRIATFDNGQSTFQFRTDLFFAGKYPGFLDQGGLLVLYPGKGGGGTLVRYQFGDGTARVDEVRDLDYSKPEDKKLFEAIFKRDVDKPLPAEYFTAPPYQVLSAKEVRARSPERLPEPPPIAPPSPAPPSLPSTPTPATPVATSMPAPLPETAMPVAQTPAAVVDHKAPLWSWMVGILVLVVIGTVALRRGQGKQG